MSFQSLRQSSSQLARFSVSSLLVIQAAIATTAIGAIASTQPGWSGYQQAAAQERPSGSARDLLGLKEGNCKSSNPDGIPEEKPSFCGGTGYGELTGDTSVYIVLENPSISIPPFDASNLFDFMNFVPSSGCQSSRDRLILFCSTSF